MASVVVIDGDADGAGVGFRDGTLVGGLDNITVGICVGGAVGLSEG